MRSPAAAHRPGRIEDQLLLACAAGSPDLTAASAEVRQLAEKCVDWDYVIETARAQGISALVAAGLARIAPDLVPSASLGLLRGRAREIGMRNLALTRELVTLVQDLEKIGIGAIPFKGPVLAITAYGNVALREFLDLDILVRKSELIRARELLLERGYEQPSGQAGERESRHVESHLGCDFFRPEGRISVELHWSLLQKWLGFEVDLDALWSEATRIEVAGASVWTLPADITLLYLCAHGTKHRWSRVCWVVDVARVLARDAAIDWERLLALAGRIGSRRTLFLGLHLARGLLGVTFPPAVEKAMQSDTTAAWIASRLGEDMFRPASEKRLKGSGWQTDWFYLRSQERLQERLCYLRHLALWLILPSEKDRNWIRLPARLDWFYILLRPFRVLCQLFRPRVPPCLAGKDAASPRFSGWR